VPQHLAAAIIVLASIGVTLTALSLLAVPIAAWSDQLPAMMTAFRAKLTGLVVVIKQIESAFESFSTSSGLQVSVADNSPLVHFAMSSS
ncbi:hypothetical protein ABTD78_21145, partial [Acinetobacter baumannii]